MLTTLGTATASAQTHATSSRAVAKSASSGVFYELYQSCPDNPFWSAVNNGAKAAAAQLHVTLKIEDPLSCSGEIAAENDLLTTIVNSHPAGVAVSVVSTSAFSANIRRARAEHIPVIAYNSLPHDNNFTADPVEAYVGQPNEVAGEDIATDAVKLYHLHSGETVLIADQCYTNVTCNDRYKGVENVVDPMHIKVDVLNLDYNVPQSAGIVKSWLELHGRPALVVALGSAGEQAVVEGATPLHYTPSKLTIVGFDDDALTNTDMTDGWVKVTVDQQPYLQGYDALVNLYTAARYKTYPINMDTGPVLLVHDAADIAKGWFNPSVVNNTGL
jgi:simple sugar transport system substrate-binding protein